MNERDRVPENRIKQAAEYARYLSELSPELRSSMAKALNQVQRERQIEEGYHLDGTAD